jgi:4-carboxymuconolactone decarboxylase
MRLKALGACLVGFTAFAAATALGEAQQARQEAPPTLDQLKTAVARLEAGRIKRPNSYDALSPEQQAYVKGILTGPRAAISGPLSVMMVSPGMGSLVQQAMAYSRFAGTEGFSSVPPKLNELGILMVARLWTADYVWNAHNRYAVQVGLSPEVVEAIKQGKRPAKMDKDVQVIYDFVDEMLTKKKVGDASFQAARGVLGGDKGVVDLVGTLGLYQISSMLVVVDELAPANAQGRLPALK